MGCQACRQSEPEANFIIKDPDIKILENQTQGNSGKKEENKNFKLKFENKLPKKCLINIKHLNLFFTQI